MQIETYEIEELTTEGKPPEEVEAQAMQLIEEMGLDGQRKLIQPAEEEDGVGTRIPYPKMKKEEMAVYQIICDVRTNVADYAGAIIPLRVLQVAAHAKPLFEEVEVWYPGEHDPDPILVGTRTPPGQSYGQECFLLARWGDELAPFEDLKKRAARLLEEEWKAQIETKLAEIKSFSTSIKSQVARKLSGDYHHTPF